MSERDEGAYLASLIAAPADVRSARDAALLDYLSAYEEYTTCHIELEALLKQGHMALSRARRDLTSRSGVGTPLGATLFPREISTLLTLVNHDDDHDDGGDEGQEGVARRSSSQVRRLRVEVRSADGPDERAPAAGAANDEGSSGKGAPTSATAVESATMAELERWGMGDAALQREIAAAVTDNGDDIAMACGDVIAIEHRDGTAGVPTTLGHSAYTARSPMSFSPGGGLSDLKRAQFAAMVASGDDDDGADGSKGHGGGGDGGGGGGGGGRPKPQVRPSSSRDPLRWFTLLPPPSLRQSQTSFRSAADSIAACANAQARMDEARARYEALMPARPAADIATTAAAAAPAAREEVEVE